MPIGANFITIATNRNITSLRLSQNDSMNACAGPATRDQRDGEDDGEHDDLQRLRSPRPPRRRSAARCAPAPPRTWVAVAGELGARPPCRRQAHADARPHEVHRQQAHDERERGDDLEVEQRPDGEPAHALHVVAVAGDPHDQRREQQRHDQSISIIRRNSVDRTCRSVAWKPSRRARRRESRRRGRRRRAWRWRSGRLGPIRPGSGRAGSGCAWSG